jgi:hypothetical protein
MKTKSANQATQEASRGGGAIRDLGMASVPPKAELGRYDHGLAEFPAFRFGKRRRSDDELIRFSDTIHRQGGNPLHRTWTVYPSAKHGYGGATTQALLFDLHQIWRAQGFRGVRIHFGTLRNLYQLQHPGKNPAPSDYERLRRDLDILCGYEFDCQNAFWDPGTETYGSMHAWHLFSGWYEPLRRRPDDRQAELPFGFIEVSETFAKVASQRGFFVTGFDSPFFHSLRPVEQRLALYLSKMFVSQEFHRRFLDDIAAAIPIEAASATKVRQTLREAASGLMEKGFPNLERFEVERGRGGRWLATFHRRDKVEQDASPRPASLVGLPATEKLLIEEMIEVTRDPGSTDMWALAVRRLGTEAVRYALADLKSEVAQRGAGGGGGEQIKNRGAWLTKKLFAMAEERGTKLTRHDGVARRPSVRG